MTFPIIPASTVNGTYQISRSLRFRSSASAYLSRTPASAGNRQTWTWSGWVKRGALSVTNGAILFGAYDNASGTDATYATIGFAQSDTLSVGAWSQNWRTTTQVFRDPSAWYHIVVAMDTTQTANADSRVRIFINGVEIAASAFGTKINPTASQQLGINSVELHTLGRVNYLTGTGPYPFDGYMAEVNFIDGYPTVGGTTYNATTWAALNVSTLFGAFDTNGVWQPKAYTGTYGTNGFYLKFSDNTSTTTLCTDYSGNSNSFTPTSISLSGTTYDSMIDSPTNYADGGNGRGNYATFNPLAVTSVAATFADGNLTLTTGLAGGNCYGTFAIPTSGKWYWEITVGSANNPMIGISAYLATQTYAWQNGNSVFYYFNGQKYVDGTASTYNASYTTNDVIGVAVDADAGTITFYKNNSSQGAITHTVAGLFPCLTDGASGTTDTFYANFGQRPFTYTPPSGFSALNTQNLPTPTIAAGNKYFDVVTRAGANGATPVAGIGFQPDFVWIKGRNVAVDHALFDTVRGASKTLYSSSTGSETSNDIYGYLSAFNSSGYSFTSGSTNIARVDSSSYTYVDWVWKAGGTGVSNTSGSITSTVSANTSAGFSVVTYTGNATAGATIGHGLGAIPSMIIAKSRSAVTEWDVYHVSLGNTKVIQLENTAAAYTSTIWNNSTPTSSVFYVGSSAPNLSGGNYVAYCFAPVSSFSAFGSFVGNGSSDGPMIFTNFRPRWIMFKPNVAGENWTIVDTTRDTYNVNSYELYANLSNAEGSANRLDILSNGFKMRAAGALNSSGNTILYAAFAEVPFKTSRAR